VSNLSSSLFNHRVYHYLEDHREQLAALVLIVTTALLLAWHLSALFFDFNADKVASPAIAINKTTAGSYDLATVRDASLFGQEAAPRQASNGQLPETRLKLVLRGVFTAPVNSDAAAIIEGEDQSASYYKVGSALPGGAQLAAVYPDRVVIGHSGLQETLFFPTEFVSGSSQAETVATVETETVKTADVVPITPDMSAEQKNKIIRARLEQLRKSSKRIK
jgi:type II secretion system protein C